MWQSNSSALASNANFDSTAPVWMRSVAAIVGLFVLIFGGISNLTTLVAFVRDAHVLWQRQYVNIAGMALADVVLCTYVCGHFVLKYTFGRWMFSATYCHVYWLINSWAYYCSLNMLVLVGYDRYLIVKLGARYEQVETWKKIAIRTILYGFVQPIAAFPFLLFNYVTGTTINDPGKCMPEIFQLGFVYPAASFAALVLMIGQLTFAYIGVYRYMVQRGPRPAALSAGLAMKDLNNTISTNFGRQKQVIIVPAINVPGGTVIRAAVVRNDATEKRRKRASKTLKYLFGSLVICSAPYTFATFMTSLAMVGVGNLDAEWWMQVFDLTLVIGWINNATNPLLYAYTMPRLHASMLKVWADAWKWVVAKLNLH